MSKLSNIGHLMCLYLDYIEPKKNTKESIFLVSATANLINQGDGRNWLPLIVKKIGQDQYELIANTFGYQVAKEANLEKVWCIIADDSQKTEEISQILTGEKIPKINLSTASKKEITQAIEYLLNLPEKPLKRVNKSQLIDRLANTPRKYLQNFNYIPRLNCGIKQGSKLEVLKTIFYLTPESIPVDTKDKNILSLLLVPELKKMAKARGLEKYTKFKKDKLVDLLGL